MQTHFKRVVIVTAACVATAAPAAHAASPTVRSLVDAGHSRSEARVLVRDLEAGGTRQAVAQRIVGRDAAPYGNSAAGLAAASDRASVARRAGVATIPADVRPVRPLAAPATIEVVRPERTIVRDAAPAGLLATLALLVALATAGFALVRTRSLQRRIAADGQR